MCCIYCMCMWWTSHPVNLLSFPHSRMFLQITYAPFRQFSEGFLQVEISILESSAFYGMLYVFCLASYESLTIFWPSEYLWVLSLLAMTWPLDFVFWFESGPKKYWFAIECIFLWEDRSYITGSRHIYIWAVAVNGGVPEPCSSAMHWLCIHWLLYNHIQTPDSPKILPSHTVCYRSNRPRWITMSYWKYPTT